MAIGVYQHQENYDSVLYYARLNTPFYDMMQEPRMSYQSMASAFMAMNQLDSAKYYLTEFYNQAIKTGQMDASTYLGLGSCELKLGHAEKALEFYKLAEANYKSENLWTQSWICRQLAEYYDSVGNYVLAFDYLNKYTTLNDSIEAQRNDFDTGIELMRRESSKMKTQMALLAKDNELSLLKVEKQRQQKNMVYGGSVFMIMLGFLGFYRYRKSKELKSKQELMQERLRISRELHDEVGATLSGIAMYSHVAKDQLKHEKHEEAENSLSYMQKSAGEMVNKLSDIVWLINPEQDTILEIIGRLGEYGKQMAGAKNMQMKLDVPSELTGLHIPLEARRNIYLICKEAINNAVKYSLGRVVELKVRMTGSRMLFSVHDDGIGFDARSTKEGNGLVSMQNRAKAIGASYQLTSLSGQGTQVEFQYDIHA
jgi:signal transduction histidine kinase